MDRLIALVAPALQLELRGPRGRASARSASAADACRSCCSSPASASFVAYVRASAAARARPAACRSLSRLATAGRLFWVLSPLLPGSPSPRPTTCRGCCTSRPAAHAGPRRCWPTCRSRWSLAELPLLARRSPSALAGAAALPRPLAGVAARPSSFILAAAQVAGLVLHGLARNRRLHDVALFLGLGSASLEPAARRCCCRAARGRCRRARVVRRRTTCSRCSPFAWGVRAAVHAGPRRAARASRASRRGRWLAIAAALARLHVLIERIYRGELDLGRAAARGRVRARMWLPGALGALSRRTCASPGAIPR